MHARGSHRNERRSHRVGLGVLVAALAVVGAACFPQAPAPPPAASLAITPASAAFSDDSPRAGGTTQQFVVKNVGGQTSGVLGAVNVTGAPEFTGDSGTCDDGDQKLSPNEMCTMSVVFTADSGGGAAVAPSQVSIAASPGGTATAQLTGTELDTTPLTIAGTPNFSDTNTPGGVSEVFTVTNPTVFTASGVTVELQNETGAGDFAIVNNNCGSSLAGQCDLQVVYTNDAGDGSIGNASIVVSAPTSDSHSVLLQGTGTGTPNVMSINAGTANIDDSFLDVVESGPLTVTVTNNGSVDANITNVIFNGSTGEGIFGMPSDNCTGHQIAPGASCQFGISYKAISPVSGTVTVEVNGSPGGFAFVVISGTATG